jgi:cytochrome c peroxidase
MKKRINFGIALLLGSVLVLMMMPNTSMSNGERGLSPKEELGKKLFFDENLSISLDQSCATCHAPETGFTGPDSDINAGPAIYPGSIHTKFGNRKPPTAAYGGESPVLFDEDTCFFVGGMFWDGRATGWTLDEPLAEQALGPFLNFLEQAQPKAKLVCLKVKHLSEYADLFEEVWGPGSLDCNDGLEETYNNIGLSIAAYEKSIEVNPFNSKYDAVQAGSATFTEEELRGEVVFNGPGMCVLCHVIGEDPDTGTDDLFTDFTYDNLGIPKNPQNPFYDAVRKFNPDGEDWIDPGLGGFLATTSGLDENDYSYCVDDNYGKHKVPTLRNVDKRPYPEFVKSYGHNGYFKSLEQIVHFYNTRDSKYTCPLNDDGSVYTAEQAIEANCWPAPEVADNVNEDELGNLFLTDQQEADLVAFMKTLSDGFGVSSP